MGTNLYLWAYFTFHDNIFVTWYISPVHATCCNTQTRENIPLIIAINAHKFIFRYVLAVLAIHIMFSEIKSMNNLDDMFV